MQSATAQLAAYSTEELLDVVRRGAPANYHEPLEATPDSGWEIHAGHAAQAARISLGVELLQRDLYILQALGPDFAVGDVEIGRPGGGGPATVAAGTLVAAADGRLFRTEAAAEFGQDDVGPVTVAARAESTGYAYNVLAGTIVELAQLGSGSAGVEADELDVTNPAAFADGRPAALDALGWERGLRRLPGEVDEGFRVRIHTLPDTTTPAAIQRALDRYSQGYGALFAWSETEDVATYAGDDCYLGDDEAGGVHSLVVHRGAFFVLVPDLELIATANYIGDDAYVGDDTYVGEWDEAKAALAAGLLQMLDRMKAAAIAIIVVQTNPAAQAPALYDNFSDDLQ